MPPPSGMLPQFLFCAALVVGLQPQTFTVPAPPQASGAVHMPQSRVSPQPFEWATAHYGRWAYSDYYGRWVWLPDTTWGPAWVEWRMSGDDLGWAPLAPTVAIDAGYQPPVAAWHYCPTARVLDTNVTRYYEPRSRVVEIHRAARPIEQYANVGGARVVAGPRPEVLRDHRVEVRPNRVDPHVIGRWSPQERDAARARAEQRRDADERQNRERVERDTVLRAKARPAPPPRGNEPQRVEPQRTEPQRRVEPQRPEPPRPEPPRPEPQRTEPQRPEPQRRVEPREHEQREPRRVEPTQPAPQPSRAPVQRPQPQRPQPPSAAEPPARPTPAQPAPRPMPERRPPQEPRAQPHPEPRPEPRAQPNQPAPRRDEHQRPNDRDERRPPRERDRDDH